MRGAAGGRWQQNRYFWLEMFTNLLCNSSFEDFAFKHVNEVLHHFVVICL